MSELTRSQQIRKRLIPFRNNVLWRGAFEMPRRLWREVHSLRKQPLAFHYHRLAPNLDSYVGTDCDAFTEPKSGTHPTLPGFQR